MAKNKNRKQTGPKSRSSQAEQATENSQRQAEQTHESATQGVGGASDYARKQNKRFGHN
ncbi:hypothetical protein [Streptomyces sp. LaPpAH-108]|uniref:hypothetical protein n=1 Tax=Streptomyces sp. LaPpAH-108 TaxID=1155714 RepID=UPI00036FD349|nr:hypothetical protein [Streptomyces sp. LaPpAH-108]